MDTTGEANRPQLARWLSPIVDDTSRSEGARPETWSAWCVGGGCREAGGGSGLALGRKALGSVGSVG